MKKSKRIWMSFTLLHLRCAHTMLACIQLKGKKEQPHMCVVHVAYTMLCFDVDTVRLLLICADEWIRMTVAYFVWSCYRLLFSAVLIFLSPGSFFPHTRARLFLDVFIWCLFQLLAVCWLFWPQFSVCSAQFVCDIIDLVFINKHFHSYMCATLIKC